MLFTTNDMGNHTPSLIVRFLIWMLPVMFLGMASVIILQGYLWISAAKPAVGTVLRIEEIVVDPAEEPPLVYYNPVFSFEVDGVVQERNLVLAGPELDFEPGSKMDILYDPASEAPLRLPGFAYNYLFGFSILGISLMFMLISTVLWVWLKNMGRKRD